MMIVANGGASGGRDRNLVGLMAGAAEAKISDRLMIASGDVEYLIELMHSGFANVVCAPPRPIRGGEGTDILLIPKAGSLEGLRAILAGPGRCLSAAGVVVMHDARLPARQRVERLNRILAECGFSPVVRMPCAGGYLLKARKRDAGLLRSAA
jgi:hypothetical protein